MKTFIQTYIDNLRNDKASRPSLIRSYGVEVVDSAEFYLKLLTDCAVKARSIQLVTHSVRFQHSKSKTSGLRVQKNTGRAGVFCTGAGARPDFFSEGGAADLRTGKILALDDGQGRTFLDYVLRDDYSPLDFLECSRDEKQKLYENFRQIGDGNVPPYIVDGYAKQLLFPLPDGGYRTLIPLFPTALYQDVHDHINDLRYGAQQKQVRELRSRNEYSAVNEVFLPGNWAELKVGGGNPQNVTLFNAARSGTVYLLSAAAPQLRRFRAHAWPRSLTSVFELQVMHRLTAEPMQALTDLNTRTSHFRRTYEIRQWQCHYVEQALIAVLSYLNTQRELHEAGWTAECASLKDEHRQLADAGPYAQLSRGERLCCGEELVRDFMRFILPYATRTTKADKQPVKDINDPLELKFRDLMDVARGFWE